MVAKSLRHKFVNPQSDGTDGTITRPSNWNDDHNLWLGGRTVTAATDTLADSDHLSVVQYNSAVAVAVTLPQAGASSQFIAGWTTIIRNRGAGTVTITPTTSAINETTTGKTVLQNEWARLYSDGTNYTLELIRADAPSDGNAYGRVSGAWAQVLPLTGGTLTGALTISYANPQFVVRKAASGQGSYIYGNNGATARWLVLLGDTAAESGSNVGSDFSITRYNDAGAAIDVPLRITRSSGLITLGGDAMISKASPGLNLNKTAAGQAASVAGQNAGLFRWAIELGNNQAESGSNSGSNFTIDRFNDAGTFVDTPLTINRATGAVSATIPLPTRQTFFSGSGTYTPPAGCRCIRIRMVGGGGGGGSFAAGANGTNTTFGGLTAGGGSGGGVGNPGGGGAPSGGNILSVVGGNGYVGPLSQASVMHGIGGNGGNSMLGAGGFGQYGAISAAGTGYGSGGGGGGANVAGGTLASGAGGGAGAYVEQVQAPGSFSYSVGAGGNGQAANANYFAGGSGAAGFIIVEEFY